MELQEGIAKIANDWRVRFGVREFERATGLPVNQVATPAVTAGWLATAYDAGLIDMKALADWFGIWEPDAESVLWWMEDER